MKQDTLKIRLDHYLTSISPAYNRSNIRHFIKQGLVYVNKKPVTKAGTLINQDKDKIILKKTKQKGYKKTKIKRNL
jgi:Predicted rRNA methylase